MRSALNVQSKALPRNDLAVLCSLLFCAALLAGFLKAPALAHYAEQRYHLTYDFGVNPLAQALEASSQSLRREWSLNLSALDRATVFGLQELTHGEMSSQQAKALAQAQALQAATMALESSKQNSDSSERVKKSNKKNKHTKQAKDGTFQFPVAQLPMALPSTFKPDYANQKISLTSGDRVLFIGDSLMQGVAPHAAAAMSKSLPGIFTRDISRQSTGLAYAGFFDWPSTAARAITEHRINTLVVFIGANDFYDMPVEGKKVTTGTPPWDAAYSARVQALIAKSHIAGVRVIWMEMPPMDKAVLRERVPALNGAFYKSVTAQKARWVGTEDLMSAADRKFSKFLPNAQGSEIQMRLDDGVHFTVAGQKRLSARLLAQFDLLQDNKP